MAQKGHVFVCILFFCCAGMPYGSGTQEGTFVAYILLKPLLECLLLACAKGGALSSLAAHCAAVSSGLVLARVDKTRALLHLNGHFPL
jgi:hypothetical protein